MKTQSPKATPPASLLDLSELRDYERVGQAIRYIEQNRFEQPDLNEIARHVGLSPHHFQRLFVRWAGVSPKQFLSYLTVQHAQSLLRDQTSVLETALQSGLSGPGRLHDMFIAITAMTPGEYKQQGASITVRYGFHPTPFGLALVMLTTRGICGLRFLEPGGERDELSATKSEWPLSEFVEDSAATRQALAQALGQNGAKTRLLLRGTRLQIQVWRALLGIPEGRLLSYGSLAEALGHPRAARAVGSAIGQNPISWIIPCHRVLRANGEITGYRWGPERKAALIGWEAARAASGA